MRFSKSDVDDMKARMARSGLSSEKLAACVKAPRLGEALVAPSVAKALSPRGALPASGMNRTEAEYAQRLELRHHAGEVEWYAFEGITLKLAHDTRFTADFAVMLADGTVELHEVKGFMRGDAAVKLKLAAELFPFPVFVCRKTKGAWLVERIQGGTS